MSKSPYPSSENIVHSEDLGDGWHAQIRRYRHGSRACWTTEISNWAAGANTAPYSAHVMDHDRKRDAVPALAKAVAAFNARRNPTPPTPPANAQPRLEEAA